MLNQVDPRCGNNQYRKASTRECQDLDTLKAECKSTCNGPGTFNTEYGVCQCDYTPIECDNECERTRPKFCCKRDTQGNFQLVTSSPNFTKTDTLTQELGLGAFDTNCHQTEIISYGPSGLLGSMPKNVSEAQEAATPNTPAPDPAPKARRKRRAVSEPTNSTNSSIQEINIPTFCFEFGDALMFKITVNKENRTLSHYPRYRKNHLFNSNPNFDYGNFRQLHSIITESNKTLNFFVHVFTEDGTFVFYDNGFPSRETVVKVMKQGEKCPNGKNIVVTTNIEFSKLGVKKSEVSGK